MNRLKSIKMKAGQKSSDTRLPKPPKPPEKPLMPYMRYSRKVWESVKNANPLLKLWEVGKIIGQMWRELPENEKSHFIEEYENDKIQYNDALRMYHNSPAYKSWLLHKEKVEKSLDDSDSMDGLSQTQKDRLIKDPHSVETRESYILEDNDEDPDEVFTVKHVAAQRFQRNHKFMLDLFSDFKIPELGLVVTESRLNSLKQQVSGLLIHKRKLDEEIEEWDKKHESKKLKIKLESEGFWLSYNKELEARPVITEIMFSEMVKRARDDIIREEKERDEYIKTRLITTERKTSISDQSNESSSKSESNSSMEQPSLPQQPFEPGTNTQYHGSGGTPTPNPFTASVVNKTQGPESQLGSLGPASMNPAYPDSHQNMLGPTYNQISQRSHANPYDNRSQALNYGYGQQPTPPNTMANYQARYPQPSLVNHPQSIPSQSISQHSVQMPPRGLISRSNILNQADVCSNDGDQKPPKLNRSHESQSPNLEKEMQSDSKNMISKEKCETSFSPPKITDSQNYPSNLSANIKAPILSPKIECDIKSNYHDAGESPIPIQSPPKKPSSKKRKPATSKSKSSSSSQPSEMDAINSGQMSSDNASGPSMINPSHLSPGSKLESAYQNDPNFSQMPLQQGMYPYHYYPPQFVPHGRTPPAQYGSPYQQGFSQPNYYNQIPQPYRQVAAPHQIQGDMAVTQYAMQHKPVPPSQPYPTNPYGPSAYGGYSPQYPSGQPFPHSNSQQIPDGAQSQAMSIKDIPISQAAAMTTHMNASEDSTKYQNEVPPVSCAPNPGFTNPPMGPLPPSQQYPAQYPGAMQYSNPAAAPTSTAGAHYNVVPGHYFYYPPGPPQSSHGTPGQNPPEHPFWSHQQSSSSYPQSSLPTATEPNAAESQPPKTVQD